MEANQLGAKLKIYFIGSLVFSIFLSCNSSSKTASEYKDKLANGSTYKPYIVDNLSDSILRVYVNNYVDKHLTNESGGITHIPIVQVDRDLSGEAYYIGYVANKSDIYTCIFSYYTMLENIPVLVYDSKVGYLKIEGKDYDEEFISRIEPYLNNDLLIELMPDSKVEINGKMTRLTSGISFVYPSITYYPFVDRVVIKRDSVHVDSKYGGFEEQPHNCKDVAIEERYDTLRN